MAMIAKHTTTVYQERRCGVINIYHGCRALTLALARLSCTLWGYRMFAKVMQQRIFYDPVHFSNVRAVISVISLNNINHIVVTCICHVLTLLNMYKHK